MIGNFFLRPVSSPRVIGHRGCRIPGFIENTLGAMRRAVADGADAIEFDVQLTRDGCPIIFHDQDLRRILGHGGIVRELTAAEIVDLRLPLGERIPSLEETLRWSVAARVGANVELKFEPDDTAADIDAAVEAVRAVVAATDAELWVIVSSFDMRAVSRWVSREASVPSAFLIEDEGAFVAWRGATGIAAVHPLHMLIDRSFVAEAHALGQLVNVWTVNDEADLRAMVSIGVDGIISDDPARCRLLL